jgi:hypothetical protein
VSDRDASWSRFASHSDPALRSLITSMAFPHRFNPRLTRLLLSQYLVSIPKIAQFAMASAHAMVCYLYTRFCHDFETCLWTSWNVRSGHVPGSGPDASPEKLRWWPSMTSANLVISPRLPFQVVQFHAASCRRGLRGFLICSTSRLSKMCTVYLRQHW